MMTAIHGQGKLFLTWGRNEPTYCVRLAVLVLRYSWETAASHLREPYIIIIYQILMIRPTAWFWFDVLFEGIWTPVCFYSFFFYLEEITSTEGKIIALKGASGMCFSVWLVLSIVFGWAMSNCQRSIFSKQF